MSNYYRPGGGGGFSVFPPIIKNLMIINVVIFFLQAIGRSIVIESAGLSLSNVITKYFALIPISGISIHPMLSDWVFYPWQLITYQFLHGDFSHIFFNMFSLWMFGMELENIWGSKKFLLFYLICGVAAGIAHLFITPLIGGGNAPTIGASGAIFGVMVAFGMLFPDRYIFIYFLIPIKAKYLIAFLVILEFLFVNSASGGNIAHLAHLGGAVAGFIYILLDKKSGFKFKNPFIKQNSDTTNYYNSNYSNYSNYSSNYTSGIPSQPTEAKYHDINSKKEDEITQDDIDRILDKISQSGYQNLTSKEKEILFEASRKMNKDGKKF